MAAKKILFLTGDFAEDYETMVPFQALQMVGHTVHAVCPGKKSGDKIKTAIHDFEGDQTYTEKPGHLFTLNASFDDAKVADYDALMVAGGRAPEYLRLNPRVIDLLQQFAHANKPIAAICHGAQLLATADIIRGKKNLGLPARRPGGTHRRRRHRRHLHHGASVAGAPAMAGAVPAKARHRNQAVVVGRFLMRPAQPGSRRGSAGGRR